MPNKISLSKYLLTVLICSFIAVFFSLVNKTYSSVIEAEQRILTAPQTKITNPKIDATFLDVLESQYNFTAQDLKLDIVNTDIQIATRSATQ